MCPFIRVTLWCLVWKWFTIKCPQREGSSDQRCCERHMVKVLVTQDLLYEMKLLMFLATFVNNKFG